MTAERQFADLAEAVLVLSRLVSRQEQGRPDWAPLTQAEALVLTCIDRAPGVSPCEVASSLAMRPPNLSSMLSSMETRGLIERERDAVDKRIVLLHIAEAGRRELAVMRACWSGALTGLGSDERSLTEAVSVLREAAALLGAGSPERSRVKES